ncbi:response regulator [Novipirellula rosea]|uniref:Response regulatory domain-containing protein n=1 Tax=Novipirellula rosea TaxID=1031540 RepID=A0ABP8NM32_9BACT
MQDSKSNYRVLVADDIRSAREVLRSWLSELKMEVTLVMDGRCAIESINETPPDLIITDIEMPRMSGLELINAIRGSDDPLINQLPVVVVTSLLDKEIGDVVGHFGGTTAMIKPLDKLTTQTLVRGILSSNMPTKIDDNKELTDTMGISSAISPTLRRLMRKAQK